MSTLNSSRPIASHIHGIRAIIDNYDAFFCDLWGVIHNGVALFPHVLDAVRQLQHHHKKIVFISNAPRRAYAIAAQLHDMGMTDTLYEGVVSSGEDAWHALTDTSPSAPYAQWGTRFYHIGPSRDYNVFEGLPQRPVDSIDACDFILNSGPRGNLKESDHKKISTYHAMLEQGLRHKKNMICLNPDKDVIRGETRVLCAGAFAHYYRERGGVVSYHGKPYPSIYDRAYGCHCPSIPKQRVIALGDSFTTDIAGADAYGIDSVLVLSGLHSPPKDNDINDTYLATLGQHTHRPRYVMTQLAW